MSAITVPTLDLAVTRVRDRVQGLSQWFIQPDVLIRTTLYLTALIYLRTIVFDYVYDDNLLITFNPWMESWKSIPQFFTHSLWGFLDIPRVIDFYRPLVLLVLAAIYHTLGPAPGWFHLLAAGMHVLATYLTYRLACETTNDKTLAAIAAGIFGLHPTKVETAAWISGISDSLSVVFFLASTISYFRWKKEEANNRKSRLLSVAFLVLALFSKEAAVFAPVLIAIHEFSASKSGFRERCLATARGVWPFVLVTLFAIGARVLLLRSLPGIGASKIPLIPTLLTAPQATLWYVCQQLSPLQLSVHYPVIVVANFSLSEFVLPLLLLLTLSGIVALSVRKAPVGIFFASWFAFMLAPVILYHITLQQHDRYSYLPSVASSIGLAYLIVKLNRISPELKASAVFVLFTGMAVLSFRYESYWDNDIFLFTRAVQIAPDNPNASTHLAEEYLTRGSPEKAEAVARMVINHGRQAAEGWYILGFVRLSENKYEEGREAMQKSIELSHGPSLTKSIGLAAADLKLGRNKEAAEIYREELKRFPTITCLHQGLGMALKAMGRTEEAARELKLQKNLQ